MTTLISPQLQQLFDSQAGCWGCKDEQSNFIYANQTYTNLVGLCRKEDIAGMTDLDVPCGTAESAHLFRAQDREVIQRGERLRILDIHRFSDKQWRSFIFTKTPLRDHAQRTIGTIFHGMELNSRELLELGALLSKITCSVGEHGLLAMPTSYIIGQHPAGKKLSQRQEEVLFLLLRGRSARQIAQALGIATRTVEWHQETLKAKFSASNKSELIDNAIAQGYLNVLPPGLSKRSLSIVLRE
ncbi:MAG: helix-turn-helix transcriptional regulator [Paludibacterium sp.]|uniref:helix-turn-helix transcriptional regulator n=1 Tax=Paludibacterium sp. TaxID=1917523 RepID=UPI0026009C36|nr:helix-turn-helix transcriptional regulator [Paludibacterium sp.]MBV8048591.1 helix-turn-helix transcriptional regulator [Paludibacterium sp.]MBV8647941.1 helix-turn-helix transcriptional regulator [Paludibacterium sp.]